MKIHSFLLTTLLLAGSLLQAEPVRYTGWQLTPEAEAKLAEFAEAGTNCRLKNNKTEFVPRAQLKYTLSKNDYIHCWFDRPLYQNTGLSRFDKGTMVNEEEMKLMKKALDLGKCSGVATFLDFGHSRDSFFNNCGAYNIRFHGEASVNYFRKNPNYSEFAEKLISIPGAFRFNGKSVMTLYPSKLDTSYVKDVKKSIGKKYADKILVVPYVYFYNKHKFSKIKPLTASDIEMMAEDLCNSLRVADGIHIHGEQFVFKNIVDNAFGFKVMLPILNKIFSDPEFKNKFLSYGAIQGLENQYRWIPSRNSVGVATLRNEMEFVAALRPDVCLLPEWDEVNENTCYRPMVNTGWSSLRMLRHFAEKIRGEKFTAFPGDDLSIPNMILCYRRRLLAGETAEFQVTNIPDQTPERIYSVKLSLYDIKGNCIKTFAPQKLDSTVCKDVTFTVPAAELLKYQLVKPKLEISWDGGRYVSPDTFWAQELCATWNTEWQWAKHPLREQLAGVKADYTITPYENGLLRLKGKISSPVPMAQAEILDGPDTVWMADNQPAFRETDTEAVIKVELHGIGRINSWIKLDVKNAPNARGINGKKFPQKIRYKKNIKFAQSTLLRLPKNEVEKAVLKINVPGVLDETVSIKEVMKKHLLGFNKKQYNMTLVVSRYNSQFAIPEHINKKEVEFDCFVIPGDSKKSVFSLRVIDKKGNTWRGGVKSLYSPSGKETHFTVYDKAAKKAVKVTADENLLTPFAFDFSPARGTVIASSAGRKYYGMINACSPLASRIGMCTRYGSLPYDAMEETKGELPPLPERNQEPDGTWSLSFDKLSHVSLPMQIVPMHAGFKVSMKIWVDKHFTEMQNIFGSGSHGFMLSIGNGILNAKMFLGNLYHSGKGAIVTAKAGSKLIPGKWNDVEITFDQKNFAVKLNNVSGDPVSVSGYQMRPKAGVLGCGESRKNYFSGKIKELSITTL